MPGLPPTRKTTPKKAANKGKKPQASAKSPPPAVPSLPPAVSGLSPTRKKASPKYPRSPPVPILPPSAIARAAKAKAVAGRKAKEAAEKAEAALEAKDEAEKAEAERKAKAKRAAEKAEVARKAKEAAEKAEAERKAKEAAETAPLKLQDSASEGSPDACYADRDEGYVDNEDGYMDNLVEETVNQVLRDRRTDDSEDDMANVNAARLVEAVLRTMADVDVEDETTMDQSTTTAAAQNLVDELMEDVWTDPDDVSHAGSNTSDRSKDFVASVVDSLNVDSDDSASEQSREFVDAVLQDLGVEDDQPTTSDQSRSSVIDPLHHQKILID